MSFRLASIMILVSGLLGLCGGYIIRDLSATKPFEDHPLASPPPLPEKQDGQLYYYRAELVRVVDGDTVDLDVDLGFSHWIRNQRFRLYGIDAPEMRGEESEEGKKSRDWLQERLYGAELSVRSVKDEAEDGFGRWLAILYADGEDVCAELIREGFAEEYRR